MDDYLIRPDTGHTPGEIGFAALHKVQSALTEGRFAIVEHPIVPGVLVAPMHAHSREDEFCIVLEGQIGFRIGEEEAVEGPGTVVVKPRGILHTFWNAGEQPAALLEIISLRALKPTLTSWSPSSAAAMRTASLTSAR